MTSSHKFRIGFSNLSRSNTFAQTVQASLEQAAARYSDIELIIRDNDFSDERALANVQEFATLQVDVAIIYHVGERIGPTLNSTLFRQKIPVIAVDIPLSPWTPYFGVNNKESGIMAGSALANWVHDNWDGKLDKLLVMAESRVLDFVRQRIDFAVSAVTEKLAVPSDHIFYLDGDNNRLPSYERSSPILKRWPEFRRIGVIGFNDESALGVLDAARELGREEDMVLVGQGGNLAAEEFSRAHTRFIASTAYYPEQYGPRLIDLALRLRRGEKIPRENFTEHICLTLADMVA